MKLVYLVDFPVEGNSGKNKATREKAKALTEILGADNILFISNHKPKGVLAKIINKLSFDITIAWRLLSKKGDYTVIQRVLFMPFTRLLFAIKGVKVINEFHADFREEIPLLGKSKLEEKILYLAAYLYDFNYKICHGIIYNHPYLKEKFDKIFQKPSIYSYNGADIENFYPLSQKDARKTLSMSVDAKVFLFLGSVSQWHGVDYVVDIFNQDAFKEQENIQIYIVGARDNAYTQALKAQVSNPNIRFIPPVDTKQALQYINAADYCLLPVKSNRTSPGSPLKLYDYIACGKPIITQQGLKGYADEVENYQLGWTINYEDVKDAEKSILEILKSSTLDFENNNRNVAVQQLSWRKRMEKWVEFAQNVK